MNALNFQIPPWLIIYFTTFFASTVLYVFTLGSGVQKKFEAFLRGFFPKHSEVFYFRWCFFVVVIVGSIIGMLFFAPQNFQQAFGAGFGWVGAVNALIKSGK